MRVPTRTWVLRAALLTLVPFDGCAYFNTLYYARQHYHDAEEERERAPEGPLPEGTRDLYLKAAKKCAKVLTEHPKSRWVDDALVLMGNCFYRREEYEKALKKYEELLSFYPKSNLVREASYMRGMALWSLGRYADARTEFVTEKDRAKEDKEKYRSWLMIARTDLDAGRAEDASAELGELLAWKGSRDNRAEALFWRGEALAAAGHLEEALDAYGEASRRSTKESFRKKVDVRMGDVLIEKGDSVEAARFFNDLAAREADPTERAKLELRVAAAERKAGRLDAARGTLEGIVDQVPKTEEAAEAQYQIGLIHEKDLRNYDDAMAAFDKVREISPGANATRAAGEERQKILELQRLQATLAELDSTRTIERAENQFNIAEALLLRMEDPEAALLQYRACQASDPPGDYGPRALLAASWVLENDLQRPDEALATLKELVSKYPDTPQAERARGLLEEKGETLPEPEPITMRNRHEPESTALPDTAALGMPSPDAIAPGVVAPDASAPVPDATAPVPDAAAPGAAATGVLAPGAVVPEVVIPDTAAAATDTLIPDTIVPDTVMTAPAETPPDSLSPVAPAPGDSIRDGVTPEGTAPESATPDPLTTPVGAGGGS